MACGFLLGTRSCRTDGAVRIAFPSDEAFALVGATLRETPRGLRAEVHGGRAESVRAQLERIVGLDQDGQRYADLVAGDPVLQAIAARRPGFRPVVAYSPYVMAGWCVLSQRLAMAQAKKLQQRMAEMCGDEVTLDGERLASFPTPGGLLCLREVPGLSSEKLTRLHAVARAALDGLLDVNSLRQLGAEEAKQRLQQIRGIGPWTADAIWVRGTGDPDALALAEPRLHAIVGARYARGRSVSDAELRAIADGWRPFRAWVSVLLVSESFADPRVKPAITRGRRVAA
jgi:DNA-3-methyladenine glycosylase II